MGSFLKNVWLWKNCCLSVRLRKAKRPQNYEKYINTCRIEFGFFSNFIFGHRPKIVFFIEVLVRWGGTVNCSFLVRCPFSSNLELILQLFQLWNWIIQKLLIRPWHTWHFWKNIDKLCLLIICLTFTDRSRGRRGSLERVFILVTLRLPRHLRRRSEDVENMLNKHSFLYIFQNCQVFQILITFSVI